VGGDPAVFPVPRNPLYDTFVGLLPKWPTPGPYEILEPA